MSFFLNKKKLESSQSYLSEKKSYFLAISLIKLDSYPIFSKSQVQQLEVSGSAT